MNQTEHKTRFQALDGLRGVFALLLLLYHANSRSFLTENFFIRSADLFVDYFFVLSGFVITYNYQHRIKTLSSVLLFLRRRLLRIYPLLFYTVLLFFLFLLIGRCLSLVNAELSFWETCLQTFDSWLLTNSTPLLGDSNGTNYPTWSISAEMVSYAFFAVALLLFRRWRNLVFASFMLCCAAFFVAHAQYDFRGDFGFLRGAFCFLFGYYTFRFSKRFSGMAFTSVSEFAVIGVILLGFWLIHEHDSQVGRILFPFVFAAGIFVFVKSRGVVTGLLQKRSVQYLGKISYSVYLNHAIVLIIFEKTLFDLLKLDGQHVMVDLLYLSLSLLVTIVYSGYTHRLIEMGVRNWFEKRKPQQAVFRLPGSNAVAGASEAAQKLLYEERP